jgi:hypothetical protein
MDTTDPYSNVFLPIWPPMSARVAHSFPHHGGRLHRRSWGPYIVAEEAAHIVTSLHQECHQNCHSTTLIRPDSLLHTQGDAAHANEHAKRALGQEHHLQQQPRSAAPMYPVRVTTHSHKQQYKSQERRFSKERPNRLKGNVSGGMRS